MFDNSKLNFAEIHLGRKVIKGYCSEWTIPGNGPFIKLIVEDKEYLTAVGNVLLSERSDESSKN